MNTNTVSTTRTNTLSGRPQGALVAYWLGRSAQQYVEVYRRRARIT